MTHGMVSAAQPEAVEAGVEALKAGGNAVDAAVATALVQTVVDPQMCGIAGFGSLQVYDPEKGPPRLPRFPWPRAARRQAGHVGEAARSARPRTASASCSKAASTRSATAPSPRR